MMEIEPVSETLFFNSALAWLVTRFEFIAQEYLSLQKLFTYSIRQATKIVQFPVILCYRGAVVLPRMLE
jgi:hypothetical protein